MPKKTDSISSQEVNSEDLKQNQTSSKKSSCSGNSCAPSSVHTATNSALASSPSSPPATQKNLKTRIVIKYNVGFNNTVYLRGNGANLNWNKGVALKNMKPDEWVWETDQPFSSCEFKVLINDKQYEVGENHRLICGGIIQYSPRF